MNVFRFNSNYLLKTQTLFSAIFRVGVKASKRHLGVKNIFLPQKRSLSQFDIVGAQKVDWQAKAIALFCLGVGQGLFLGSWMALTDAWKKDSKQTLRYF